jgi:hypothetical protein
LLQIGEYTVKGKKTYSKQTVNFRVKDVTFFKKNRRWRLEQIPRKDLEAILKADAASVIRMDWGHSTRWRVWHSGM